MAKIKKKKVKKKRVSLKKKITPRKKSIKRTKKSSTVKKKKAVKKNARTSVTKKKKKSTKRKSSAVHKKRTITKKKASPPKKRKSKVKVRSQKTKKSKAKMISTSEQTTQVKYQNMSQEDLDYFKKLLLKHKKELMEEVDRTVVHMQTESNNYADANDRATQEEEFGRELKNRDRERKLIKKINSALARIDSRTFGYCEECGVPIGLVRLKARPTTTMCVDCKLLAEVIEKQN